MSYLVVALESERPLAGGARFALDGVARVTLGRGPSRAAARVAIDGVVTLDVRLPASGLSSSHARLIRVGESWAIEDTGSRNGTFVNGARIDRAVLGPGDILTVGRTLLFVTEPLLTGTGGPLDLDSEELSAARGHVTLDPELDSSLDGLERIAASGLAILIRGETGTGKDVLARAVHRLSGRPGELVAVNCGAIPANLIESHLFGHVKGAFSGALRDEPGLFRAADRGTLFLDEIGDLPPASQAALLRAIQEREVLAVGATRPVKVDLRVVAATHQPLESMVEAGTFRRDLLARLSGFTIDLPPLRARRMDVGILVGALLRKLAPDAPRPDLTPEAALALLVYDWPLNIRELEQALSRALVLADGAPIDDHHLPNAIAKGAPPVVRAPLASALSERDDRIRTELLDQLARHHGNLADVARAMGKARMQIHRWCKRFGIDPNAYRV